MSLSKFEKKKEKLLQKNARLQAKANRFDADKNTNKSDSASSLQWNEMIRLLSTKDLVLRPQELFEYFALLIQSFAGSNITIALNRNAHLISSALTASQKHNYNYNVCSIACIIPIINDSRWKSSDYNHNFSKHSIIENNISAFAILTDRKTLMRKQVQSYQITPYFLSNKYEWNCIRDVNGVYLSTLCKDYRVTGDLSFKQRIVDNSYINCGNIQECVIICSNKYGYIPVFCSQNDIFYTDPRIKYHDIKNKWNENIPRDDIIRRATDNTASFKKRAKKMSRNNPRLKTKSAVDKKPSEMKQIDIDDNETKIDGIESDNDENQAFNVSLSIMADDFGETNDIVRLWTQSNGKIYALRADGILYDIRWKSDENAYDEEKKEDVDDINGIIRKLDEQQPNYKMYARKGAFKTDLVVKVWKHDPNINNYKSVFETKCNKQLKECKLFEAIQCGKFDMVRYNQRVHRLNRTYDTMHTTLAYGIYYDEDGDGLYIAQNTFDRINNIHSWDVGFIFNEKAINEKLIKEYEALYDKFMEKHKYLKNEQCYVMFVDERKLDKKQIIIICGKYLVQIGMLNKDGVGINNKGLFGNVYGLNEVMPELSLGVSIRGAKWYYSYVKQTLYVFERLSVSSNYPYRLRQIALSSFQFRY